MKQSKRRFFSGNSVEQAVTAAACEYDINAAEVAFKKVEKRHGFLRARKRVVVEVDPKTPRVGTAELPDGFTTLGDAAGTTAPPPVVALPLKSAKKGGSAPTGRVEGSSMDRPRAQEVAEASSVEGKAMEAAPGEAAPGEASAREASAAGAKSLAEARPGGDELVDGQATGHHAEDLVEGARLASGGLADSEREDYAEGDLEDDDLEDEDYDDEELTPAEEAVEVLITVTGLDLDWEIEESADRVEVVLEGPDAELLLREHGKPLFAFEHLLPKVIRGISGEKVFCQVDSQGFRENRRRELEDLALSAAEEVKDSGEPKTLPLLNPSERRIVHMTLADDGDVETESEGGGYLKRLTIWPS